MHYSTEQVKNKWILIIKCQLLSLWFSLLSSFNVMKKIIVLINKFMSWLTNWPIQEYMRTSHYRIILRTSTVIFSYIFSFVAISSRILLCFIHFPFLESQCRYHNNLKAKKLAMQSIQISHWNKSFFLSIHNILPTFNTWKFLNKLFRYSVTWFEMREQFPVSWAVVFIHWKNVIRFVCFTSTHISNIFIPSSVGYTGTPQFLFSFFFWISYSQLKRAV